MAKRTCSIDNCDRLSRARGWCRWHYDRWVRHGDPLGGSEPALSPSCAVEDCARAADSRGWCAMHYLRWRRNGDPLGRRHQQRQRRCSIKGCEAKHYGHGWCRAHYAQWRKHGDPLRKRKAANGKADFYSQGYHFITVNGQIVREHRHVMEQVLGRLLRPDETPHHKNGDRADNRPENLELWVRGQPAGQRAADLLVWAEEIAARYGPERDKL